MNAIDLYMLRYNVLYDFWLYVVWEEVPHEKMRERPHPQMNSLAWNMWHITRVEDAAINRFITDQHQVLDDGDWAVKMNYPQRHNGYTMTFDEVDELNLQINLDALRAYSNAVHDRTLATVPTLHESIFDEVLTAEHMHQVIVVEGLAKPGAEDLAKNYTGWTKGGAFMNHCLTHPYHHVGEMNVISGLLGFGG